jgi:hypothetical protein
MSESNLRKLFVEHAVSPTPAQSDRDPLKGTAEMLATDRTWVMFRKHPEDTVFIIDEDGKHVQAISKPKRVLVPLVEYPGGLADVEAAVQERLHAILDAVVVQVQKKVPRVPAGQAVSALHEMLEGTNAGGPELHAMMATEATWRRLPAAARAQTAFYVRDGMPEGLVYGLAEPSRVGHIVFNEVHLCSVGILCVGGVVAVRLS